MTKHIDLDALHPTFSMQHVEYSDGSWGVTCYVTGLASQAQADAAMAHMERLFCGDEIKERQ